MQRISREQATEAFPRDRVPACGLCEPDKALSVLERPARRTLEACGTDGRAPAVGDDAS